MILVLDSAPDGDAVARTSPLVANAQTAAKTHIPGRDRNIVCTATNIALRSGELQNSGTHDCRAGAEISKHQQARCEKLSR